jgi:hypothetical protein
VQIFAPGLHPLCPRSAPVSPRANRSDRGRVMIDDAVKLMRVYERQSKSGKRYFIGFLGQSRVLIMRDDQADRADLNDGTIGVWDVFLKNRDEQPAQRQRPRSTPVSRSTDRHVPQPARAKARQATSNTTTNKRAADIRSTPMSGQSSGRHGTSEKCQQRTNAR